MCRRSPAYAAVCLMLCLAASAPLAAAATYCVAPNGDDSHAGSEAQPWKTLRKAAAAVQPGDTVRIKAGEYAAGPTWIVNRAGTAEKPITYRAFGDGEVRINNGSLIPPESWQHVKGKIYSTPVGQRVMAVFRESYPLHNPGERAKIFAVADMIPNSFYVADKTLYVWLEDGSHPKDSAMRAAPGHVVSLYDCHHTIFDGLTVEYGFNGIKDQGKATHHIIDPQLHDPLDRQPGHPAGGQGLPHREEPLPEDRHEQVRARHLRLAAGHASSAATCSRRSPARRSTSTTRSSRRAGAASSPATSSASRTR